MLMEQTLEKMNQMKLSAMVEALEQQRRSNQYTDLGFEERLGLLVDEEWTAREHRKLTRRLRAAKLRYATASLDLGGHPKPANGGHLKTGQRT